MTKIKHFTVWRSILIRTVNQMTSYQVADAVKGVVRKGECDAELGQPDEIGAD